MGWVPKARFGLDAAEKELFDIEYAFARNLYIGRQDLLDMPYAEARYWLEKLNTENLEMKRRMDAR